MDITLTVSGVGDEIQHKAGDKITVPRNAGIQLIAEDCATSDEMSKQEAMSLFHTEPEPEKDIPAEGYAPVETASLPTGQPGRKPQGRKHNK